MCVITGTQFGVVVTLLGCHSFAKAASLLRNLNETLRLFYTYLQIIDSILFPCVHIFYSVIH